MTILITGGSGLIGKYLSTALRQRGYHVRILSRNPLKGNDDTAFFWDVENKVLEKEAFDRVDYIIHLAGANIGAKRWTAGRRQEIVSSRVESLHLLYEKVNAYNISLKGLISASATGFYDLRPTSNIFSETDTAADGFLGEVCNKWEQAADLFASAGIRTVKIRTGIVLTPKGGALAKLALPVKFGMITAFGHGRQYIPWIHVDDLCGIYIKAIEDTSMMGAYNAVAPGFSTNREFIRTIARVLGRSFRIPNIPAMLIKLMLGKMAETVLYGNRISAEKIMAAGYHFSFSELEHALRDLFHKNPVNERKLI